MRDPQQYSRFSDERSRPFFSLIERIPGRSYKEIVDLGCGTGSLTASLSQRWPEARVVGLDMSPEMLTGAAKLAQPGRLEFEVGDIATYDRPADLIVSNAALQWLGDHNTLFPRLASLVKPGGVFAVQIPSSFHQPSHLLIEETARSGPWAPRLTGWRKMEVNDLDWYADLLLRQGFSVDAWQTTYNFVLQGDDPVLEWVKGTTLQPILSRLTDDEGAAFCATYAAKLRDVYPSQSYGTIYPFTRLFFVAAR
jgi:trans-aconitate 2-methyltransferase